MSLLNNYSCYIHCYLLVCNQYFLLKWISVQSCTENNPRFYSWVFSRSCQNVQISSIYQLKLAIIVCVLLIIVFFQSEYSSTSLRYRVQISDLFYAIDPSLIRSSGMSIAKKSSTLSGLREHCPSIRLFSRAATNHNPGGIVQVGGAAFRTRWSTRWFSLIPGPWAVLSHSCTVSASSRTNIFFTAWAMCKEISILRRWQHASDRAPLSLTHIRDRALQVLARVD